MKIMLVKSIKWVLLFPKNLVSRREMKFLGNVVSRFWKETQDWISLGSVVWVDALKRGESETFNSLQCIHFSPIHLFIERNFVFRWLFVVWKCFLRCSLFGVVLLKRVFVVVSLLVQMCYEGLNDVLTREFSFT